MTTVPLPAHPLDPLAAEEFEAVRDFLAEERDVRAPGWRYTSIELREPSKDELARFDRDGEVPPRVVEATLVERARNLAHKAKLDLGRSPAGLLSWEELPGVQPNMTVDEWEEADAALRKHPDVVAALAKRGITDMDLVFMDVWTYGHSLIPEQYRERRVGWSDTWLKESEHGNPYAHPVNGFHCVIDINTMELLEIEDTRQAPMPDVMGEYLPELVAQKLPELYGPDAPNPRPELKPLDIVQTDGISFEVNGHELTWQNWKMRVGFNYREGMTLHQVSFNDHGVERPVAHKLSFAEMVVPYRDPSEDHYRRTAFDVGEWGLGFMTTSLELGCDCLGEIRYLDATLHDSTGTPYEIKNAICIHEEDNAVLWKHVDHHAGAEVRRMRRFVVSFHVTVANYEYITYWRFYQDGNIECEVRATGIMVTGALEPGDRSKHGTMVDKDTYAPIHQHFIVARMDLDVDGPENTVVASETEMLPLGPDNPYGLALTTRSTPLRTEKEGRQDANWNTQKAWKVINPNKLNAHGDPVAYKLSPTASFPHFFPEGSPLLERAGLVRHQLWVTPNEAEERWPAGEFVNQSRGGDGLPKWTEADRNIENTDVVLWHVFGIHHVPRVEDWPIMPADTVSFWLKPAGFFDRNPSIDVKPQPKGCHVPSSGGHGDGGHDDSGGCCGSDGGR